MEYQFLEGHSLWIVYSALFTIVFARTQATYWIGRGLGAGVRRSKLGARLGGRLDRAERLINRFGPPVVTVAYVTVGVQTAIHLTAGAMRMAFPRYLLAMIPGCAIWAAIYSLGGMAVLAVWWGVFTRSPELAITAAALLAAAAAVLLWLRRRHRAASAATAGEKQSAAT